MDVPDHEIFPALLQARRVEFRVGSELAMFNRAASGLAWLSRRWAIDWTAWASWLAPAMGMLGFLGHDWGVDPCPSIAGSPGRSSHRNAPNEASI